MARSNRAIQFCACRRKPWRSSKPNDGQGQQKDQLQGAGLKETITHAGEDFFQREMGSKPGRDGGSGDHQQRIEA